MLLPYLMNSVPSANAPWLADFRQVIAERNVVPFNSEIVRNEFPDSFNARRAYGVIVNGTDISSHLYILHFRRIFMRFCYHHWLSTKHPTKQPINQPFIHLSF